MTEIEWNDYKGGAIIVDQDGVMVYTDHCGCESVPLTDRRKILALYHALGDWLMATNPELSDPPEKVEP